MKYYSHFHEDVNKFVINITAWWIHFGIIGEGHIAPVQVAAIRDISESELATVAMRSRQRGQPWSRNRAAVGRQAASSAFADDAGH